ncbi:MAG: hypothetical protein K2X72_23015 [Reyranella sp.]|nr:hypothetical protein [Reyranella sp.]
MTNIPLPRPRMMPMLLKERVAAGFVKHGGRWVHKDDLPPEQQVVTVREGQGASDTRFKPGHVGGGRPKGSKNKLSQKLIDNVDGILDVMIGKAMEGDAAAATLVVNRVLPVLRPQSEKVQFVLNVDESISHQVGQVLAAIAKGEVAADVGKKIMESIMMLHQARAQEDIVKRIEALEAGKV